MPNDETEIYEVKRIGGKPTPNSGRGRKLKGDGIIHLAGEPLLTIDVKEYGEGYTVSRTSWAKILSDARHNLTDPCLKIVLGREEPRPRIVAISEDFFNELLDCYRERHEQ